MKMTKNHNNKKTKPASEEIDLKEDNEDRRPRARSDKLNKKPVKTPEKPEKTSFQGSEKGSGKGSDDKPVLSIFFMVIMFIISIGFALVLAPIYVSLNLQADFSEFGGEESLIIPFFYLAIILIFTAVILFITRKRRGRFLKYGFLGIIALSMMYVFYAVFSALFFPVPAQSWSNEVKLDGSVTKILITDLVGDNRDEVLVGTDEGEVLIYDSDLSLLASNPEPLPGLVSDIEVVNRNILDPAQPANETLILVAARTLAVYELQVSGDNIALDLAWTSENELPDFEALTIESVEVNQYLSGSSLGTGKNVLVGSNNIRTDFGRLSWLKYTDQTYHLEVFRNLNYTLYSFTHGSFQNHLTYFTGGPDGVHAITLTEPNGTDPTLMFTSPDPVLGMEVKNIDRTGGAELITWDERGIITIYEPGKTRKHWDDHKGEYIGGVAIAEIFSGNDDLELVVSVDGSVVIYYTYKEFLDKGYEFTIDTGTLDSGATGLAVSELDDNDEPDIIVGHAKGFNHFQYESHVYSDVPCIMGIIVAVLLSAVLFKYPEWYLVDIVGIVVAGGVTALLGISIGLLPIIVLLIVLAIYDAISVYKTKHMVSLADKVMEFKLPILLVVPKKRGYSFLKQKGLKKQLEDGEEREAMFIGLGDIIIPGALVVSAFHFLPATVACCGIGANLLVAIFTMVGVLSGFAALMHFVLKGNPQAGLPLLNTGAILGFFISNFAIYQDITFGMGFVFG